MSYSFCCLIWYWSVLFDKDDEKKIWSSSDIFGLQLGESELNRSVQMDWVYSLSLCHSAICRRGELHTSFQWFCAVPMHRGPPNSNRPMTWIRMENVNFTTFIVNHRQSFYLILSDSVPVEQHQLQWNTLQIGAGTLQQRHQQKSMKITWRETTERKKKWKTNLCCWNVKGETLVEHRTECSFFHVGLLFGDALSVVEQIYFHVRIGQSGHVHAWQIASLQQHDSEASGSRLPT